jgi:hypothetical protein
VVASRALGTVSARDAGLAASCGRSTSSLGGAWIRAVPRFRLSLGSKRVIAGLYLAWLLFCAGNYYLELGLLGGYAKVTLFVSVLGSSLAIHLYGPEKMKRELKAYKRLKRMREDRRISNGDPISPAPPNNRWRGP